MTSRRVVTWGTMTPAEKVTLHTYPALCLLVGSSWLATPESRLSESPALRVVSEGPISLSVWGTMLLLLGAGMLLSLLSGRGYWALLAILCGVCAVLGSTFLMSAFTDTGVASSAAWPAAVSLFCWASIRSLAAPTDREELRP